MRHDKPKTDWRIGVLAWIILLAIFALLIFPPPGTLLNLFIIVSSVVNIHYLAVTARKQQHREQVTSWLTIALFLTMLLYSLNRVFFHFPVPFLVNDTYTVIILLVLAASFYFSWQRNRKQVAQSASQGDRQLAEANAKPLYAEQLKQDKVKDEVSSDTRNNN